MKRREFIQSSAVTAAGLLSLPALANAPRIKGQLGLQLYTLRESIVKAPKEILRKVSEFGYRELETFGYRDGKIYGMPFAELNKCE